MSSVRLRAQLGLLAAFVVLGAAMAALLIKPRVSRPVAVADVGTIAPDFQLEAADGRIFTLSAHRGQAVVLFFGAANCPRTADYNARVDHLARSYATDRRVAFFAVDMTARTQPFDRQVLRGDAKVAARGFPTLIDDRGAVAVRYSAKESPTFVILDAYGIVRYRGPFDNNVDFAYATQSFCAQALGDILGSPTAAVAGVIRR
jgi:cytochrome oxidase Cu insertion factor (SCO1/SenC/PrrC family)